MLTTYCDANPVTFRPSYQKQNDYGPQKITDPSPCATYSM